MPITGSSQSTPELAADQREDRQYRGGSVGDDMKVRRAQVEVVMVAMMGVGGMPLVGVSGVPVRMSVPIPQQPGAGEIGQ